MQAAGGETATEEAAKQVLLLQRQLYLAEQQGRVLDAKDLRAQLAGLAGGRAYERGQVGIDRARNNALLNRNPRAAQAVEDFNERQKLRDRYQSIGLSTKQADSDFALNLKAQAAGTMPRIVADSLQSIGGGGRAGGSNPMLAAQQRVVEVGKQQLTLLKIIAGNTDGGDVMQ